MKNRFTPPSVLDKRLIDKALSFLVRPIIINPAYFLLLYALFYFPDIYNFLGIKIYPFIILVSGFLFCYVIMLPIVLLPPLLRKIYKYLFLSLAILYFLFNVYSIIMYNRSINALNPDAFAAILATNISETSEFIQQYFEYEKLLLAIFLVSLLLALFYVFNRAKLNFGYVSKIALSLFILFSVVVVVSKYDKVSSVNMFKLIISPSVPNLCDYKQNPDVIYSDTAPQNIVMIIGESFSKSHSSLYGYEKNTNPMLAQLTIDSVLKVYPNATSYAINTIPSIKSVMMSYVDEYKDSIEWYECLTVLEVLQKAGYTTHWISNQSKFGLYDNEVGRFADLCDKQAFTGDLYAGLNRKNYDEELIPILDSCLTDIDDKNFFVIQMMGSHSAFKERYPARFERFVADDYKESFTRLSDENKKILSEYDNSILYNDSVVYEIMKRFTGREAVVFYFSDHAIDVFQSSDEHIAHARNDNVESLMYGKQIPFMVYTTEIFRERFPQLEDRMRRAVDVPYRTDSVMYTIMDVAGVREINGVSYRHKSLFN